MAEESHNQEPQNVPPSPNPAEGQVSVQTTPEMSVQNTVNYQQSSQTDAATCAQPAQSAQSTQPAVDYAAQQYAYTQPNAQYAYSYQQYPAYTPPIPAAGTAPAKKQHHPFAWLGGIALILFVIFTGVSMVSCSTSLFDPDLMSVETGAITTGDTIAVINLDGTIGYDGSSNSPEGLRDLIHQAETNPDIKAIVLRVNSGGGSATAGEEMAQYIKDCSKPIVVSSAALNASAAYEISSQADYIYVNKSTEIGAIGTVLQLSDISKLLDMIGIKVENIASAESKDSSYGTRPLTDEEREYYQYLVDTLNEDFVATVAEGRDMDIKDVKALANGMIYAGTDSVENGLADEIGTYDDAIMKAAELGMTDDYDVVTLYVSNFDIDSLLGFLGADVNDMTVGELIEIANTRGTIQ